MSASAPRLLVRLATGLILTCSIALPVAAETVPSSDPAADDAALASLYERLASMNQRMNEELGARVAPALTRGPREVEAEAALQGSDRHIAAEIHHRVDDDMNSLSDRFRADAYAKTQRGPEGALAEADGTPQEMLEGMKMKSGSLELEQAALSRAEGRSLSFRHRFDQPFDRAPAVAIGVRVLHLPQDERPRVALRVLEVDAAGFDYEIRTSGSPAHSSLQADWVAYLDPALDPEQAAAPVQAPAARP
jgi:hypothetical protein